MKRLWWLGYYCWFIKDRVQQLYFKIKQPEYMPQGFADLEGIDDYIKLPEGF